jgi:hypothetical protein
MTYVGLGTAATPAVPVLSAYGQRVARFMMQSVAKLPSSIRVKTLKTAMDRIDPTLYTRSEQAAQPELKAGVPASIALERGIAHAASHGIAHELVDLGKGKRPARQSQLGMVCYGCALLGGYPVTMGRVSATAGLRPGTSGVVSSGSTVIGEGSCSADGQFIYKGGAWVRRSASDTCVSQFVGGPKTGPGPGGTSVVATPGQLQVGPWVFANNRGGSYVMTDPKALSADAAAYIRNILTTVKPPPRKDLVIGDQLTPLEAASDHRVDLMTGSIVPYGATPQRCDWFTALGLKCGTLSGVQVVKNNKGHYVEIGTSNNDGTPIYYGWFAPADVADLNWQADYPPIAKFKHPQADEDWGVYLSITRKDPKSSYGENNPSQLKVYAAKIPQAPWYQPILDAIHWLTAGIIDPAADLVAGVAHLACELLTGPAGEYVGAGAGAVVGGPAGAQAGKAGADIAAKACANPLTCPPGQYPDQTGKLCMTPPPPPTSSMMPIILIGGAGLAAILLLSKKRKP